MAKKVIEIEAKFDTETKRMYRYTFEDLKEGFSGAIYRSKDRTNPKFKDRPIIMKLKVRGWKKEDTDEKEG